MLNAMLDIACLDGEDNGIVGQYTKEKQRGQRNGADKETRTMLCGETLVTIYNPMRLTLHAFPKG